MKAVTADLVRPLLPKIEPSRNKYEAGYVVALAGSPDLEGAAILACSSAMRAGAGIVRWLRHPEMRTPEFLELVHQTYTSETIHEAARSLSQASAALLGPGIGREGLSARAFLRLIGSIQGPCCIDADGLNLLASHPDLRPPQGAVLTPHLGELARLLHLPERPEPNTALFQKCQNLADDWDITLILKGGPTYIFHPNAKPHCNRLGNPGMATAGSGDILTGILAALLAQKLSPLNAALLGTYLHNRAGDLAAERYTPYSLIATDIRDALPTAFRELLS
jgi:ADP-dependent NAD(P)H-hydrate dehydratase / NAD(P)H-hydrate epimerase